MNALQDLNLETNPRHLAARAAVIARDMPKVPAHSFRWFTDGNSCHCLAGLLIAATGYYNIDQADADVYVTEVRVIRSPEAYELAKVLSEVVRAQQDMPRSIVERISACAGCGPLEWVYEYSDKVLAKLPGPDAAARAAEIWEEVARRLDAAEPSP